VWKYGNQNIKRSAVTLAGAYMLLRTIYTIDFIKEMIEKNKTSTLRELYYISESWGEAKFNSQDESDKLAEDLEIITKKLREDFKLRPEEDGARVIGDIVIEEVTRKGEKRRIHCQDDVGDAGYGIPYNVEKEKIRFVEVNADKVIAVETGGMFDRLVENRFDEKSNSILVHLKGQPARSTRRFLKRLNEELNLPVIVFTDGDPWSYRIYASVAYGAIKTAHISEYLATPSAQFLGVTPSDILNYDLPSDELTQEDINALKAELSDPRFQDDFWINEIKLQLEINKKAEQQALAKYGLDYVTDVYLPEKLAEMGYEI
ncbi:MAG: DNA topoisomerase VI, partial [Thermoplasmata archaeon]